MTRTVTPNDSADTFTHEEWLSALRERFGPDPMHWAFVCPSCGDVATGADHKAALAPLRGQGDLRTASDTLGRECIGRLTGALRVPDQGSWDRARKRGEVRGCDWAAFGLFAGPVVIDLPDGRQAYAFRFAPATEETTDATR